MPDIRIEVPRDIKAIIADRLSVEQGMVDKTLADIAAVSAEGAVGATLGLKIEDFWVRVGEIYSNAPVVYVNVAMLAGEERTKEVRKKLAITIAEAIAGSINKGGPKQIYVLTWIDQHDPDADHAEVGPDPE